jgi:hypothetical protein
MNEFNYELIKNKNEFARVVRKIQASGITDDEEISEIIVRDYRHLFRELTEIEREKAVDEMLTSQIESSMAKLNRESIAENGHPFAVCQRVDGVKQFKRYDALTNEEISELKAFGVIL